MNSLDKIVMFTIISLCLFGIRFEIPIFFSIAGGLSLGAALGILSSDGIYK